MQAIFPSDIEREPSTPNREGGINKPAGAAFCSPAICMPQQQQQSSSSSRMGYGKPETNTYELIKAPGIVRPLYDIITPAPQQTSRPPLPPRPQQPQQQFPLPPQLLQQQQALRLQQQQQQQQQQYYTGQLAALGGPRVAAAAAALEVTRESWFEDLQQQMKREELQQYADTAPPAFSSFASAPGVFGGGRLQPTARRLKASVLREEAETQAYAMPR
ncbi:uncharacterized protein EMH_0063030 [Eimeria mitis]|uniref:Uncharacterized protein n=1 Tax=Eimeria mitis TaxID=44415 RepID=U6JZY6_9EIME|nr:uncharacterized protein EMH_0063030 [Eimeria mitis]CDJ30984.1 hypothetical protein, conserved [Eimeria mitis]